MLSGKTQWRVMSTFWHKMSDLKPVCSIKICKLSEKSHFCAFSVIFLRLVCILKLEGILQAYVNWKNTMTGNVNFMTQNVGPWTCYKQFIRGYWAVPKFLRLGCILKLEDFFISMLSGKTNDGKCQLSTKCRALDLLFFMGILTEKYYNFVPSPLYFWV